ncbi:OmpA family protein [Pikeienuella piscinae]|uniref:OmpA family protein n=1 Tax=Pikeienuella piscinae TaxID=2748098 RepID=A0A7L5BWZ5_9RHOB|nr:OmpA family protein [Pikeienuella piscinae]QIE54404.1 OmpA family protein [Pikeienuella piscinae]
MLNFRFGRVAAGAFSAALLSCAVAAANPLAPGWTLYPEASKLTFQSVKNGTIVEESVFATFSGAIEESGEAEIVIQLESVDTGIDLRNVRMRFLFFESFRFPEARVTATLDPAALEQLAQKRRMTIPIEFTLDLHGVAKTLTTDTVVTLITDDMVSVAADSAIVIPVADFDLDEGLLKLQDAAKVTITPSGSVGFDFVFRRDVATVEIVSAAAQEPVAAPEPTATPAPAPAAAPVATAAVEASGDFSEAECEGRFEIISRAGAIYFPSGGAELKIESAPLLAALVDIIERCPTLNVAIIGHTDSDGAAAANQKLSEARAASVLAYLTASGAPADRLFASGRGETAPVAPNDTARNKRLNRRIEFAVVR